MIKIIKPGKDLKQITKTIYTITCPDCGCVFECEESDIETFSYREYGGLYGHIRSQRHIVCPHCSTLIDLNSLDIQTREELIEENNKYEKIFDDMLVHSKSPDEELEQRLTEKPKTKYSEEFGCSIPYAEGYVRAPQETFLIITDRCDYTCHSFEAVKEKLKENDRPYIIRYYIGDIYKGGFDLESLKEKFNF